MELPAGWEVVFGELPEAMDFASDSFVLMVLNEDMLYAKLTGSDLALDIGWYPDADRDGEFRCKIIRADDWQNPTELFCTRDLAAVRSWLENTARALSAKD